MYVYVYMAWSNIKPIRPALCNIRRAFCISFFMKANQKITYILVNKENKKILFYFPYKDMVKSLFHGLFMGKGISSTPTSAITYYT